MPEAQRSIRLDSGEVVSAEEYEKRSAEEASAEESSGEGDSGEGSTASFASESAEAAAEEAGLTLEDFEGREPSGKTGYTVADVEALAEEQEE